MSSALGDVGHATAAQRELARLLIDGASDGEWSSIEYTYVEGGDSATGSSRVERIDGSRGRIRGGFALFDAWSDLRAAMVEPETGTWLSATVTIQADGTFSFDFNYDVRPYGGSLNGLFSPPDAVENAQPSDDDWREELRRFPRAAEFTPDWLATLAAAGDATAVAPEGALASPLIVAALAAPVTWPDRLAVLADSVEWSELFDAVATATGEQLDAHRDISSGLSSESKRAEWGGWLDGLLQGVFGDVFGRRIESGDVAGLERVWRPLERAGLVTAPAGLENVDRSAPVTGVDGRMPDVVQRLIDDVSDALGDIIAQQLTDRFGFAPEP